MKLHDSEREKPFEALIDARFPYNDHALCTTLIAEARTISLNATFCVLDEICRPPMSAVVTKDQQRALLAEWASNQHHELIKPLLTCANALVERKSLPWRDAVAVMEIVGNFDGQRAALSLAYFSADSESLAGDAALSSTDQRIRKIWEEKAV